MHSGIAVYAVGRTVHALRISDGNDVVLATAPRAIAGLAIEPPGIVYAYNTVKGIKDVGNLAFVPLAKATPRSADQLLARRAGAADSRSGVSRGAPDAWSSAAA